MTEETPSNPQKAALQRQALRNRTNQRNFRQRRQDRIKELEAEVHRCRTAGVQATKEVQHAARVVAAENLILREVLIQDLGFNKDAIAQLVRERLQDALAAESSKKHLMVASSTGGTTQMSASPSSAEPAPGAPGSSIDYKPPPPNRLRTSLNGPLPIPNDVSCPFQETTTPSKTDHAASALSSNAETQPQLQTFESDSRDSCKASSLCANRENNDLALKMSCEKAAEILSKLRFQDRPEDIRSVLGCTSSFSCLIDNVRLLEFMNEST